MKRERLQEREKKERDVEMDAAAVGSSAVARGYYTELI